MKEFEMRNVGSHIEVYTAGGVFLFSADTVREAMEELDEAGEEKSNCKIHVKSTQEKRNKTAPNAENV